jgi:hypothetical protein
MGARGAERQTYDSQFSVNFENTRRFENAPLTGKFP